MRIHLFTTDPSGLQLENMLPSGVELSCVIIPQNRRTSEKVANVVELCQRSNIEVFEHKRGEVLPNTLPIAERAISWLYSQIISKKDLERYPRGMLNMHGGKIPDYRGASVMQWQIINGEKELGITWHEIVEEVDAGPIWAETVIPINEDATAFELRNDMIHAGLTLFKEAWLNSTSENFIPRKPDLRKGRVWPNRQPKDGFLTSEFTAKEVRNTVRALSPPWPPATTEIGGKIVAINGVFNMPAHGRIPHKTADGETLYLDTYDIGTQ